MIATTEQPPVPDISPAADSQVSPDAPAAPAKRQVGPSRKGAKDVVIERFEQKFIVHPRLVPQIRKYLESFTVADPNGKGDIPEYITTTLQLDTPTMDLALAKERKCFARFKLRIRTYGTDSNPGNPVFFELKRKVGVVIIKSRARMKRGQFKPGIVQHPETAPMLKSPKENNNLIEFCRIVRTIGATPKMLIRYIRESWKRSSAASCMRTAVKIPPLPPTGFSMRARDLFPLHAPGRPAK
jgi:hypothetical protein